MGGRGRGACAWPARAAFLLCVPLLVSLIGGCGRGQQAAEGPSCDMLPAELRLSEIMLSPAQQDEAQWLEIHNTGDRSLHLGRLLVTVGDEGSERRYIVASREELPVGGYRRLGRAEDFVDRRVLRLNRQQGRVSLWCQGTVLDTLVYGPEQLPVPGPGESLSRGKALAGLESAWCITEPTPGESNPVCGINICEQDGMPRAVRRPVAGELVLNELMLDLPGVDDNREWLELRVLGDRSVDLNGLQLLDDGDRRWRVSSRLCLAVMPGDYPLLAVRTGVGDDTAMPDAVPLYGPALPNGTGELRLQADGQLIDRLYLTSVPQAGTSLGLDPAWDGEGERQYCAARSQWGEEGRATPGEPNDICGPACLDAGGWRALRRAVAGELVLNEVMADPEGADAGAEWLEIFVAAVDGVDLNDLELVAWRGDAQRQRRWLLSAQICLPAQPGQYLLLGGVAAGTEMLAPDVQLSGLNLYNDSMTLELWQDGRLLDRALLPEPASGVSQGLDPARRDATANDRADAFCAARSRFALGRGSPGGANDPCGAYCREGEHWRAWQSPGAGSLRINEIYPNPSGADDGRDWIELYVDTAFAVDLNGLVIEQRLDNGRQRQWQLDDAQCLRVQPGAYVVVAGEGAERDGVAPDHRVKGLDFYSSSAGEFLLRQGDTLVDNAQPVKAASGVAVVREWGSGLWCRATAGTQDFAGLGSPGEANPGC